MSEIFTIGVSLICGIIGGAKPMWRVRPVTHKRARTLRPNSTNGQRIVWRAVRAHRLNGISFRRQPPIGPDIVDFICRSAKLIIESDDGQHFDAAHQARDARRDNFLRAKGFRVLRFRDYDVMTNLEGACDAIAAAVGGAVTPSLPSPASAGGFVRATTDDGAHRRAARGSRR